MGVVQLPSLAPVQLLTVAVCKMDVEHRMLMEEYANIWRAKTKKGGWSFKKLGIPVFVQ